MLSEDRFSFQLPGSFVQEFYFQVPHLNILSFFVSVVLQKCPFQGEKELRVAALGLQKP